MKIRITKAEATEIAQFFLSKKYMSATISNLYIWAEPNEFKAHAICDINNKSWGQNFKVEVVMDLAENTITAKEHRYIDNLAFYRNPDLQ